MAELASWLSGAVSAAVSVVAGIVSVVAWFRAKGEREEAARQAATATDAAKRSADSLERIADIQQQKLRTAVSHQMVLERDPWIIRPDPEHTALAELYNDSPTAKYGITVTITVNDQPYLDDQLIEFVGPNRSVRIDYINLSAEIAATITWYLDEARTMSPPPQIITW